MLQAVGNGAFGEVHKAEELTTHHYVAVKDFKVKWDDETAYRRCKNELENHALVEHPSVVALYGHFFMKGIDESSFHVYIILELCSGGSIESVRSQKQPPKHHFSENETKKYCVDILEALVHMHELKIMHRDIKPANILITDNGRPKIADFGFSVKSSSRRRSVLGTWNYMAPEIVDKNDYSEKVDCWSFGVMVYILLVGEKPYNSEERKLTLVPPLLFPDSLSVDARDFTEQFLTIDPEKRMSFKEALSHRWIQKKK